MQHLQTHEYMEQMDESIEDKLKMVDWTTGQNVLDCGCGSGGLMEYLIHHDYNTYGIDLSSLSENLIFKKKLTPRFVRGDLLYLGEYFPNRKFDTIIFSSVLHEVYSYNDFDIQKVVKTLQQAIGLLSERGRIIIRDGINHPDDSQQRVIEFMNREDLEVFNKYYKSFKGRKIYFNQIDNNKIILNVNDAMEFLYTYTWGNESFYREVQEQYGIFNSDEYQDLLESFGLNIIHKSEYLQAGYIENLKPKVNLYDEHGHVVDFPNSNMLLVAEK
ncbi:methyltransferase domain-containing protein [Chromohalobacter nigrandesensis]|uniref:methyltransferase domain-containing protein n=1 Tax=Chromohalobacter nigrandesensis TaxID=119863 RepID=UPI001FF2CF7C|nr:methyltransferase domain-containing protein [Chromohalobacter nigrandesensis]MCK0744749.1 methyltransferase domain-containing protein [Chromohalobacter nigrandesensis]